MLMATSLLIVRGHSFDPAVSDPMLWCVSTIHLGHGSLSDSLLTVIRMQAEKAFSSHSLLTFLHLRWGQKVASLAHLCISGGQ